MYTKIKNIDVNKVIYLLIGTLFIILSCSFLDRPLARWVYTHNIQKINFFSWITFIPNTAVYLSVCLVIVIFAMTKINISRLHQEKRSSFIIAIAFSAYLTIVLTKVLKFIFGRIGPKYWVTHNFNLNAYGFYPFHGNQLMYQDFPSGHTAASFAIISIICCVYPKLSIVSIFLGLLIVVSLIFTQSHYFSDCIGGAFLGTMIGLLTARFFEIGCHQRQSPNHLLRVFRPNLS